LKNGDALSTIRNGYRSMKESDHNRLLELFEKKISYALNLVFEHGKRLINRPPGQHLPDLYHKGRGLETLKSRYPWMGSTGFGSVPVILKQARYSQCDGKLCKIATCDFHQVQRLSVKELELGRYLLNLERYYHSVPVMI
jgi:hypothetical protein